MRLGGGGGISLCSAASAAQFAECLSLPGDRALRSGRCGLCVDWREEQGRQREQVCVRRLLIAANSRVGCRVLGAVTAAVVGKLGGARPEGFASSAGWRCARSSERGAVVEQSIKE